MTMIKGRSMSTAINENNITRYPICGDRSFLWGKKEDHHYGNIGCWTFNYHIFQDLMPDEISLSKYYPKEYYAHQQVVS